MMALGLENSNGKTPMDMADCEYLRCESVMDEEDHAMIATLDYETRNHLKKQKTRKNEKKLDSVIKACKDDLPDKVFLLLQKQADPNERDKTSTTPLMHASRHGNIKIAKILLEAKADPNLANKRKNTALHFAFESNNRLMVKLLMQSGAEKSVKKKNAAGKVPQMLTTKAYLGSLNLNKLTKAKSKKIRKQKTIRVKDMRA